MPQGLTWRKSSYSDGTEDGNCVEVALAGDALVRDSKNREGAVLTFASTAWQNFLGRPREDSDDQGPFMA